MTVAGQACQVVGLLLSDSESGFKSAAAVGVRVTGTGTGRDRVAGSCLVYLEFKSTV